MPRRARLALALLLAVAIAGCDAGTGSGGTPAASDDASAAAKPLVPEAGTCHRERETVGRGWSYAPVDCATTHKAETVHVGRFTGAAAGADAPPPTGSPELRAAFDICDAETTRFVGAEWRGGLMSVQVVPPAPDLWATGSRWYRCDVFVVPALDIGDVDREPEAQRDGSLRGVLTGPSPLAHGCFNEDEWTGLHPAGCTTPHRFEYVGVWTPRNGGTYDGLDGMEPAIYWNCGEVARAFANVSRAEARTFGISYRKPSKQAWERGDRGIRCLYWSSNRDVTRSIRAR